MNNKTDIISRFLKKVRLLTNKKSDTKAKALKLPIEATVMGRAEHCLSRKDISEQALKVLYRLHKHGFKAYLVGGSVRDLLLGTRPKDFDVVTDAHPEQIKKIFNNCRLIGRRFRLAHVYFDRDIIEVATFRAPSPTEETSERSKEGMILRDNEYGTIDEDVWRRDFTINALYYNIADFSIVDYTGGLADLKNRTLQIIGEPYARFREDPVRMLRAIRFAGKMRFQLDPSLLAPMVALLHLLNFVSPARLYEELVKMIYSGESLTIFQLLSEYKLFEQLFAITHHCGQEKSWPVQALLTQVLLSTDARVKQQKPVTPAFVLAGLLWYPMLARALVLQQQSKIGAYNAQAQASDEILAEQAKALSMPRRITHMVREIWRLQLRLERRVSRRVERLTQEIKFRAAYDFLLLRAKVEPAMEEVATWWQAYVEGDARTRRGLLQGLNKTTAKKRKAKSVASPAYFPPTDQIE